MKKITKIAACGLLAALGLTAMTSCGDGNNLAKEVVGKVILTQDGEKVSADFIVPKIVKHDDVTFDVSWTSSDTSVLEIIDNNESSYTADVKRPFGADETANADVNLTASVTANGKTAKSNFKVTVTYIDAKTALSAAITNVGINASYGAKEVVELPTKSNEYKDEITFEYSLGGEYASAKLEGTKLTLDPELGQETIVVKVKATCGSEVVEKDVTTKTSMKTVYLSVSEALNQPKDAMIYVQGKIKSVASNGEKYGNFWIEDEAGKEIEIYGLYKGLIEVCYNAENVWQAKGIRYDAWEDFEKLAIGDYVYAYGKRATYNTTEEVSNCVLMGTVKGSPASTVKEALDTPKGEYVTTYGEVKSVVSDKYGNIYLKDTDGNEIYLYGLYNGKVAECYPDGKWSDAKATRYDNMKDKPVVGDVIAVYGPRDEYNGTAQIKNAILLYYVSKTERKTEPETPPTVTPTPTPAGTTIAKHTSTSTTNLDKVDNPTTIFGLDDKIFTVTFTACASGTYSNTPGLNKDGTTRLYNNTEGEGNSLTFTVAEGYKIESMVVTLSTEAKSNGTLKVYTTEENVLTAADGVYTVNGNTVTLKNVATESSHQVWIIQIEFKLSNEA
ncbi:MAG: hypothetical protein K2O23_04830 [Anaeroplasmataceae bacterium]|nr:hypothetical protein [Anaeroplasmataceae bacterium]